MELLCVRFFTCILICAQGDGLKRMIHVAGFAASAYASTKGRSCKPFNPLLGETYEADYPDKGIRFISEKVQRYIHSYN